MKQRITIQVNQSGKPVGEFVANIEGEDEQAVVDLFMKHCRIDLRYRFLGPQWRC